MKKPKHKAVKKTSVDKNTRQEKEVVKCTCGNRDLLTLHMTVHKGKKCLRCGTVYYL